MKRLLLMTAVIVISMAANAKSNVVVVSDVANYIDFQTLSKTDSLMTKTTVTSTTPYTLANGSILKGYSDGPGTEAECKWVLSDGCTKDLPTPAWNGVDSLYVGTMFRAPANVRIELGASPPPPMANSLFTISQTVMQTVVLR